jgi:hypothetical protein
VRLLTDGSGAVSDRYAYEAFASVLPAAQATRLTVRDALAHE